MFKTFLVFRTKILLQVDAWIQADKFFLIKGLSPSLACQNIEVFETLTDEFTYMIKMSEDERLKPAQDILNRIENRDFYEYKSFKPIEASKKEDVEGQFKEFLEKKELKEQIGVIAIKIPEGKGNINPNVTFINEASEFVDGMEFARKIDSEQEIVKYIFYVKDGAHLDEAKLIVEQFCQSNPAFHKVDF